MNNELRVTCRAAPRGYAKLQGAIGVLHAATLPSLGYVFWPGGQNPIGITDMSEWNFSEVAGFQPEGVTLPSAVDPIIEASRAIPPLNDRADYLRSLIGLQVKVTSAPEAHKEFIGEIVHVNPPKEAGYGVVTLYMVSSNKKLLTSLHPDADGWVFESPIRRSREKYDASAFADELEVALVQVRDRVIEARRTSAAQPHLPEGISMQEATLRVVEALVLRKLTGEFEEILDMIIDDTRVMLLHKNAAYGDSALNPVRVFSKAPIAEQLLVRLDDKVSRLTRGSAAGEDVAGDALGYLVLVEMAERRECANR